MLTEHEEEDDDDGGEQDDHQCDINFAGDENVEDDDDVLPILL